MAGKRTAWALCAAWMGVIFLMSAMPGDVSSQESGFFAALLLRALSFLSGGRLAGVDPEAIHLLVRKAAHMAEYFVLFLLYARALRLSGVRRAGAVALLLCACYAATDEFHQGFVDARGPSPVDVCIDTAGAALAWGCRALWRRAKARSGGRSPSPDPRKIP